MTTKLRGLWTAIGFVAVAGLVFFGATLTKTLSPSESARAGEFFSVPFPVLEPDEARILRLSPRRAVLVFRPSERTLENLDSLESHVADRTRAPFDPTVGLIAFLSAGPGEPCGIEVVPPAARRSSGNPNWKGGFFDRCAEVSYDFLGRTIKTGELAIYHRGQTRPNLVGVNLKRGLTGNLELDFQHGS